MKLCCLSLCAFLFLIPEFQLHASETNRRCIPIDNAFRNILKIFEEQPDSIEGVVGDRVYLTPRRIAITHDGTFLCHQNSMIP
jgi:hypothetical protein